jgi:hypothetical protein
LEDDQYVIEAEEDDPTTEEEYHPMATESSGTDESNVPNDPMPKKKLMKAKGKA